MSNGESEIRFPTETPEPDPGNSDPEAFTEDLTDDEILEANQAVETAMKDYGVVASDSSE